MKIILIINNIINWHMEKKNKKLKKKIPLIKNLDHL